MGTCQHLASRQHATRGHRPEASLPNDPPTCRGFTDAGFGNGRAEQALGPAQKRAHLRAFMQQVVGGGGPTTLVGTSLGGTVAIDYATNHGEDLERLVLIDAQVGGCHGEARTRGARSGGVGGACRRRAPTSLLGVAPPNALFTCRAS